MIAEYKILQVKLSPEHVDLIKRGREAAIEQSPRVAAYYAGMGFAKWESSRLSEYTHVATAVVDTALSSDPLEDVFSLGNGMHCGGPFALRSLERHRSVSVGDLVEDPDGDLFMVAPEGFARVSR